jgi:hypothetical protein
MLGFVILGNPEDAAPPRPSDHTVPAPSNAVAPRDSEDFWRINHCIWAKLKVGRDGKSNQLRLLMLDEGVEGSSKAFGVL